MSDRSSNKIGGACGVLAILLTQIGFGVAAYRTPGVGASDKQIADFVSQPRASFYGGEFVELLGFVLLVVFIGRLWAHLRRAEAGDGWLSTTAFGSALAAIAVLLAGHLSAQGAAFYTGRHGAGSRTVASLLDFSAFAQASSSMLLAVFLGATALVVLRHAALPRWLGWFAAVVALAFPLTLPFPNDFADLPVMLFVLWVVAASVVLLRRGEHASTAAAAAHAAV